MLEYPQSYMNRFIKSSCYIFALGKAVEMLVEKDISAHTVLDIALASSNVSEDGYVKDANAFVAEINPDSKKVIMVEKWQIGEIDKKSMGPCKTFVKIEHYDDGLGHHHFKLENWDSLRYQCDAVKNGKLKDYRLVKLIV